MRKKNWALLWGWFIALVIIYLFIYCNALGIMGGWIANAYVATRHHLDKNTALVIFIVLKDIAIIWWIFNRRWSK